MRNKAIYADFPTLLIIIEVSIDQMSHPEEYVPII